MLLLVDWDSVTILQNIKVACNRVLEIFSGFYDIAFPKQNILEIKRLSRVYQKKTKIILSGSLKRNKINAERYTIYKTLFETLKKKSKKSYHVNLNDKYKHYVKKTKDVIREIIGKSKFKIRKLPPRILIDKKKKRLFKTL